MNKMKHMLDTMIHKKYILEVGEKVVKRLEEDGRDDLAFELAKRLIMHDNSKISKEEITGFIKIENQGDMTDPNKSISEQIKANIEKHWKNNRHHPEHYKDYHEMKEVDVWEMCCDWYSRSLQHKTDFIPFVLKRQEVRFHFDEAFFDNVLECCKYVEKACKENKETSRD